MTKRILPDEPLWERCAECRIHLNTTPFLVESFASVGIEHGKGSYQMAEGYFEEFHKAGHSSTFGVIPKASEEPLTE